MSKQNIEQSWKEIKHSPLELANSVDILLIFDQYGIATQEHKIICPFLSHSNGMEKTPSFYIYEETNSFYCFGCKKGGGVVKFVSYYENLSVEDSITKVLSSFSSSYNTDKILPQKEYLDNYYYKFSNLIRENIKSNNISLEEAEKLTYVFDTLNSKYNLNANAIGEIINKLKYKINFLK